jgi:hypothetical protein
MKMGKDVKKGSLRITLYVNSPAGTLSLMLNSAGEGKLIIIGRLSFVSSTVILT